MYKRQAVESRPAVDYFPAFPGQQVGNYMYPSGKTVHLPIDQRYGGTVTSGIDAQGRPYSLRGYAYLDGSLCFVDLDGDGIAETTMEDYEVVALATQLNGLDNFAYINALIDAGIFVQADDVADTFDMWTEDITLYALMSLIHISLAVTEHDKKETASTWTVAERDNTELHDSETFVDRYGRLNPNKGATAADWRGYTHLKNGPFLKDLSLIHI